MVIKEAIQLFSDRMRPAVGVHEVLAVKSQQEIALPRVARSGERQRTRKALRYQLTPPPHRWGHMSCLQLSRLAFA